MDALNEILRFLQQYHLKSVVNSINHELNNPKRAPSPQSWVKNSLADIARVPLKQQDQNILSGLIKKLCQNPKPAQPLPVGLKNLKVYKKLALQSNEPNPKIQEEKHQPSEPKKVLPQQEFVPTQVSFPGQAAQDDLFSASKIEHRQQLSSIHQSTEFGQITIEQEVIDQYDNDDDPGYIMYQCSPEQLVESSRQIAQKHGYPDRALARHRGGQSKLWLTKQEIVIQQQESRHESLPSHIIFPPSQSEYYPITIDNVVYDVFNLKVIFDREKTGFEETKDFQIVINSVIAGRYQVVEFLGSAAFSKAIQCLDLVTQEMVCLKIVENNKDYVDQSIDEIKLLKYININGDPQAKNFLRLIDYFYHKEHLIIVTELLRDNLYQYQKYNREHQSEPYFTIGKLQKIAYQVLVALEYLHSLHLVHCDLKPENILIKSYSRCQVKVIDLGSTCFIHDHLGSYVQSRSYRAPEVIMGCPYDYKIDIWSLGCILAEMLTGYVLFQNDSVQGLLARVIGICGGIPEQLFKTGRHVNRIFTKDKLPFQEVEQEKHLDNRHLSQDMIELIKKHRKNSKKTLILVPKRASLKTRLHTGDQMFIDFIRSLLEVNTERRPTASEALRHPWITECKYEDGLI